MSMVRCHDCEAVFSSDNDPDCFVNPVTATSVDIVRCQWCRDRREIADELDGESVMTRPGNDRAMLALVIAGLALGLAIIFAGFVMGPVVR